MLAEDIAAWFPSVVEHVTLVEEGRAGGSIVMLGDKMPCRQCGHQAFTLITRQLRNRLHPALFLKFFRRRSRLGQVEALEPYGPVRLTKGPERRVERHVSLGYSNDRSSKSSAGSLSTFALLWSSCIVGMPAVPTLIECEFDRRMPAVPTRAKAASAEIIKIFIWLKLPERSLRWRQSAAAKLRFNYSSREMRCKRN
jgi:hypothetical protein